MSWKFLTSLHVLPHGSGLNIFQAFTTYLKSKKADDKSKDDLVKELAALDEHLQKSVSIIDVAEMQKFYLEIYHPLVKLL